MYDTSFYCTYNLMDSDEDKNYMYRLQFLDAFGLKKYDDDKINEEITLIHNKIKECPQFKEICKACKICQEAEVHRKNLSATFRQADEKDLPLPRQAYGIDFYGHEKGEILVAVICRPLHT